MSNHMFCFQCEQTVGCGGCTGKLFNFFYEGLFAVGEDWDIGQLLPVVMKV